MATLMDTDTMNSKRDQLRDLLLQRAYMEGDFVLASGKHSSYYIDGKRVMFHPLGLLLIAETFIEAMASVEYDAVGGLEMGAIPIASAIALRSAQIGNPKPAFFVRKSTKSHGTKQFVEGCVESGNRVVICDDVITTGGSAFQAIQKIEEFGCEVVQVVALVDREQGGAEEFKRKGYIYTPLFTLSELKHYAHAKRNSSAAH